MGTMSSRDARPHVSGSFCYTGLLISHQCSVAGPSTLLALANRGHPISAGFLGVISLREAGVGARRGFPREVARTAYRRDSFDSAG
jgi:hypothetical protein